MSKKDDEFLNKMFKEEAEEFFESVKHSILNYTYKKDGITMKGKCTLLSYKYNEKDDKYDIEIKDADSELIIKSDSDHIDI